MVRTIRAGVAHRFCLLHDRETTMVKNASVVNGKLMFITFTAVMVLTGGARGESDTAATVSLGALFDYALENNPEIKALRHAVNAKKHDVTLATSLPDPSLSAGYFITPVETRVGPQRGKVGASQMIPWPGKLIDKKRIAEKELSAETEKLSNAEAALLSDITDVYAALYATGKTITIDTENLKLLQHMESVLLARYSAADVSQMSVLKLQVEMSVLNDEIESVRAEALKQHEALSSLLGGSAFDRFAFPRNLPSIDVATKEDDIDSLLSGSNPTLKQLSFLRSAANRRVRLSKKAYLPDFMLMTDYLLTDESNSSMVSADGNGKNPWVVAASVTVPLWWHSKNAGIGKMKNMEAMASEKEKNMFNLLRAKLVDLHESYNDVERKITLFETVLVPKAKQSLALFEETYANGKASVLDFLDAQRMLLDLEIKLARRKASKLQIAGKIDMLSGGKELMKLSKSSND